MSRPCLREALEDYLSLRRALGFQLGKPARLLGQFAGYLEARGMDTVTAEAAVAWARQPAGASPRWHANRLSAVRGFAAYLHGLDPAAEVVPAGQFRADKCRATPYLYSGAEISSLTGAAAALRPAQRAATYRHLIALLAVSGIRIGEAIGLDHDDLDTGQDALTVRHAKSGSHRLVPLHPTTAQALQRYARLRQQEHPRPASPALFLSVTGRRLQYSHVRLTFAGLTRHAGLTPRSASCRPRIHDLRHSFAVATVLDWYRDGADIPALMPRLSAYLGHTDPRHTYWYMSAAPELMALAGQRLENHLAGQP